MIKRFAHEIPADNVNIWRLYDQRNIGLSNERPFYSAIETAAILKPLTTARLIKILLSGSLRGSAGVFLLENGYVGIVHYRDLALYGLRDRKEPHKIFFDRFEEAQNLAKAQADFWEMDYVGVVV